MLRWRLLLGFTFIAAVAGLCALDHRAAVPGAYLWPLAVVLGLAAAQETRALLAVEPPAPLATAVYPAVLLVLAGAGASLWQPAHLPAEFWLLCAFFAALVWASAVEMWQFRQRGLVLERLAKTWFVVGYAGLLWGFLMLARMLGRGTLGIAALVSLLLVVKLSDTAAYFVGRALGRHKMAPHLSPGKTWEGACGALGGALGGAWLGLVWLAPKIAGTEHPERPWGGWIVYGLVVGLLGVLGDLLESLLKRDAGRKDSSTWMPGFGGVLDLLDSILLAAPAAYLLWRLGGG